MKHVLIYLKECLDQKDIDEAEAQARACGLSLDEWLVCALKAAIHRPDFLTRPPDSVPEQREPPE